jgi:predicted transcriptional regulator
MLPQELEVWYVIPAIRRELAKGLVAEGLSQKQVAEKLGLTGAAVSQYLSDKRADKFELPAEMHSRVAAAVKSMAAGHITALQAVQLLTREIESSKTICDLHHRMDSDVPRGCDVCFTGEVPLTLVSKK